VLIGDLAFLHDLNSLELVRASQQPITIVLLNNNGGGIFGLLPIAEYDDVFEQYFTTPHGLTFELSAAQFGIEYTQVRTLDEFQVAYIAGRDSGHSSVIEVMVNRNATIEVIRSIERSVRNLTVD
jgi:2-succinyl-5-enolpyruvyl-6-hydroxy-3-cyclohexene-1-carboxylate synthase